MAYPQSTISDQLWPRTVMANNSYGLPPVNHQQPVMAYNSYGLPAVNHQRPVMASNSYGLEQLWPRIVIAYIVMAYPQSTISSTAHDLPAAGAPKLFSEAKAASDSMTIKNAATTSYN